MFDIIIIGAGSAGYSCAIRSAQLGKKVLLVEKDQVGGTCLNKGCIPTKTLLHGAELFAHQKQFDELGLSGTITADPMQMQSRKEAVVAQLRSGIETLIAANAITLVRGNARIADAHTVMIEDEKREGHVLVVATGSSVSAIPIEGIEHAYNSDDILQFGDKLFDDVCMIGGGVIGIEFACLYQQLGKQVTILEGQDRLLTTFDKEISQNLTMILKRRKAVIQTNALVRKIAKVKDQYEVTYDVKGEPKTLLTSAVILAAGRHANGVDSDIPLVYDGRRIQVNANYQTSVPSIYAIGDAASKVQLAHLASHQGTTLADHLFQDHPLSEALIPMCVYTSPEIACVGLQETEAKEKNIPVITGKYSMLGNGKTIIAGQDRGFVKIVADAKTRQVLGAQLMCDRASDMISQFTQAIAAGLTVDQLQHVIYPHPSFSEGMHEAVWDVDQMAIHVMPRKK